MRNMLRAGALALVLLPSVAFGQSSVLPYWINSSGVAVRTGSGNPLPVSGSFSASLSGFPTIQTTGTPISVTTGGVTGTLPAGAVVVASNVGATNGAYCKLGASATTSDQLIPPNSWFAFTVGANTQLTCITSTSTTTVNMVGGSGLPTGSGGGGGGSGGGGAITMASGAVASGAYSSGSIASGAFASGSVGSGAVASGAIASGAFASGSIGSGAVASGAVASGAYASGSIGSGAMVDLGAQADAACGTDTGTCSAIALIKRGNQTATTTANNTAAAIPTGTARIGYTTDDPCNNASAKVYTPINTVTANNTIIAGVSAKKKYICHIFIYPGATVNFAVYQATTGTSCATAAADILGGHTTATGFIATAQNGFVAGTGSAAIAATNTVNTDICITNGGTVQLSGSIVTVDQ